MQLFDEMYTALPPETGNVRDHYRTYGQWLDGQPVDAMGSAAKRRK